MKICMISYSQYEHDSRVHRYSESLVERGDSVDVICLGAEKQPRHVVLNGVHVYRIQTRDYNEKGPISYLVRILVFFIRSFFLCTRFYLIKRYQVLHFHNVPDFGVFCTLVPKLLGAKVILDVHDLVPEFYQRKFGIDEEHPVVRLLKWIEKLSARYADHVITVTRIWKNTLTKRSVPVRKCSVVLNSPDPRLFKREKIEKKGTSNTFRLIFHGNLTEIFGIDIAIKAVDIIRQRIPEVEFQIYGHGRSTETLLQITQELRLEKNVHFNDSVSRDRVPKILRLADVGIDPKRDGVLAGEGLSSKCMEYLAVGIPAVVSRIKAAETYYDDSMVMFFEPGNERDLARAVIELYNNPEKRHELVKNSERFMQKHHWYKYRDAYYDVLNKLIV